MTSENNNKDIEKNVVHCANCIDKMKELPDNSVHAVVTDPPYGLAFMGKSWDDFTSKEYQRFCTEWARECKRVLKPGGHLLAFSGNRTHHRLFAGVEDAGFEIRDTITWHYGSGFPKAADISKMIDKRRDEEEVREVTEWLRERIDESDTTDDDLSNALGVTKSQVTSHWAAEPRHKQPQVPSWGYWGRLKDLVGFGDEMDDAVRYLLEKGTPGDGDHQRDITGQKETAESWDYDGNRVYETGGDKTDITIDVTAPATDAAREWDGWKTGLKPATEFIVMARKPFDGATVDSVLEHGTGALNIDACRVEGGERPKRINDRGRPENDSKYGQCDGGGGSAAGTTTEGRYPPNVVFDETAAERLDQQVGELEGTWGTPTYGKEDKSDKYGDYEQRSGELQHHYDNSGGGPSRYFYTSKASRSERTEGGSIDNDHPTVKPLDLAEWLIRLVTREGQVVLDPFAGSGTIPKAAKGLGRQFLGIERQARYADIARVRCGLTPNDPATVRSDDAQRGFEAYTDGGAD